MSNEQGAMSNERLLLDIADYSKRRGAAMKADRNINQGANMNNDDRRLIVETLGEMRQLKGEMREFKEHVMDRVGKLEKQEAERTKKRVSVAAVLISGAALAVSIFVNFIKHGGK
jgi:L-lactate utilization protein LutB